MFGRGGRCGRAIIQSNGDFKPGALKDIYIHTHDISYYFNNPDSVIISSIMGVQRAASAYSLIYGPHDHRVHKNSDDHNTPNNVYFFDLPTFHVPTLCSISSRAAAAIINCNGTLGQMVLFSASGIIYDILFDENCCILPDDIGNILNEEDLIRFKNYKKSTSSHNDICINIFCSMFKLNVLSKRNAEVILIPVTVGDSFDTHQKLKDFQRNQRPKVDLKPMPQCGASYKVFREWLEMNNVPEATFINFDHIYNAVWKNNAYVNTSSNETYMYNCAKMAHDMEGFLLLYGLSVINKLKQLPIDKRKNNKFVLFTDGKPPVIKKYSKTKRDYARKNRLKNKMPEEEEPSSPEMLYKEMIVLFERVSMSIPTCLLHCVLLDVLRIPFFNQMGVTDQLFFTSTIDSEAEDDIVRITAFAANIDTGIRGDVKTLIKLKKPDISRPEEIRKIDIVTNSFLREEVTWKDACMNTLINSPCTSIIIFSYDSDVLPKWNMMVKHSFDNRKCHDIMKKSAENIESIYFYRSLTNNKYEDNNEGSCSDDDGGDYNLLKRKSDYATNKKISIYDLTQSPVMHSVESTLLLMLINGCDYVDALVSSTVSNVKIREEVTLFEHFACLCYPFEEEEEEEEEKCCYRCGKYIVSKFNIIKRFLLKYNVSNIFKDNYPAACNSAANVLAMLSLSCFNQKIFGSARQNNNSELSIHIMTARYGFFSEYTQGGIPLCNSQIEKERMKMFKDLGSIKNDTLIYDIIDNIDQEIVDEEKEIVSLLDNTMEAQDEDEIIDTILSKKKIKKDNDSSTTLSLTPSVWITDEEIIKKIESAMMCEDNIPSHAGTEDYILSLLTAMLKTNVKGLGEKRINNMTYCAKVMNLLIILYLNMCGQQDPTVSDCQYTPVIHHELQTSSMTGTTTRNYFIAAINEISFYMYRPELKQTSKYSQTRRQRWKTMMEKLIGFDNEMMKYGIRTPCNIKPVYGLVRVKSWSALSLLGAILYYKHKSGKWL